MIQPPKHLDRVAANNGPLAIPGTAIVKCDIRPDEVSGKVEGLGGEGIAVRAQIDNVRTEREVVADNVRVPLGIEQDAGSLLYGPGGVGALHAGVEGLIRQHQQEQQQQ